MLPSLFLAHGSPMIAIEDNEYTDFLQNLGKSLQPKAIVVFTAHWEERMLTVSSTDEEYETIYDFGGFPPELYQVRYPARGSTALAAELKRTFEAHGITAALNHSRGLDHGVWTLLVHLFPKADVPVIQISVNPFLPVKEQYAIGQAVRTLGREDMLVIGSGVTVHNLRQIHWGQQEPEPWAVQFDDWLIEQIRKGDLDALAEYETKAPNARLAVPRPEHFVPLFIAMGSGASPLSEAKILYRGYDLGTLSYLCFQF
ncbi:MFS transporter [Gordoniibacillus kamchatkensis]|uniref:MFS transporter n=1 Tax=Gordoniibacillus kamchatkensis TaxID=1590651 RepID=A0ABR5A9X6_9BACL|nr:class III extradiol ring-cleavage dioxygenase [Paenibacillus sp. VKM B-2647]KIL37860.1 MFS transporter [Paenibacillus sp. VKM B-2647]